MESTSMRWSAPSRDWAERIDWGAAATWLLGFGLVVYLGLEGGGYDPLVHDQVGIALWWVLLVGVLVGAFPRRPVSPLARLALGLFAAFVAWTALSLIWTESGEKTLADLARVGGYLGVLALAILSQGAAGARRLVASVGAGIACVAIVGLLSRLHPAWFPEASQTARFLANNTERLSYPLNYWNGLAALIAIGVPLLLHLATGARLALVRGLAAAALPAMVLAGFFTLSRNGIAAAFVALAVYLALAPNRLPKVLTLCAVSGGGAILIFAADRRQSLQDALLNSAAREQGNEVLVITVLVCLVVGAIQIALTSGWFEEREPDSPQLTREHWLVAGGAVIVMALAAIAAFDAPGKASDAWIEFKRPSGPGKGTGRLGSAAGQSRYQYWSAAVDENASRPLTGTGSGTFQYWWARNGDNDDTVRDAHSLYMQTLGELGVVGLGVLSAFLLTVLVGCGRVVIRADAAERSLLAAALAGCLAFSLSAGFDWLWQIPVLPVAMLLLAAVLLGGGPRAPRDGPASFRWPLRIASGAVAAAAIVAIAVPLASTSLVRQSEADAREGDLLGALKAARSAQNAEPWAATPRLQEALLLEELGDLGPAAEAARGATEREHTNWRTWLVLSRIEAQRGRPAAAIAAYRRARSLNPRSPLFEQ
jgi:hypothetical protein